MMSVQGRTAIINDQVEVIIVVIDSFSFQVSKPVTFTINNRISYLDFSILSPEEVAWNKAIPILQQQRMK